ncbi:MAG TPA: PEPxxWA-CTERM sorting domain-containing protein [Thiobacillaceae bacterium]|nr:PEPxxWA-CTERM sorting domain-containing protein [Thiobacillaceae bacterium]
MNLKPSAVLFACLAPLQASANIDIVFDYSYDSFNFFADPGRKSLLEAAASVFESRIGDSLTAINPTGSNHFQVNFADPANTTGSITPATTQYQVAANDIIIYVGGASLTGSAVGEGGPGGYSSSGSQVFLDNAATRGQTGVTTDTDFSLWGGSIRFNKDYGNWFFDSTLATDDDISGVDFYSVAVHEIAHVLGFGTADSWDHWVTGTTFDGPNTLPTALTNDAAHWADGTTSTINSLGSFEAAMDPSINTGTRKNMTDLDWNGMRDIGWQVSAVPEPQTWAMLLAGLGVVGALAGRRRA